MSGSNRDEKPQGFNDEISILLRRGCFYNLQINHFDPITKERRSSILSKLCANAQFAQSDTPEMRDKHMNALREFVEVTLPARFKKLQNEARMRDPEFKKMEEWGEKLDLLYSAGLEKIEKLKTLGRVTPENEITLSNTLFNYVESARWGNDSQLLEECVRDLDALILRYQILDLREAAKTQIDVLHKLKGGEASKKYEGILKKIPEKMYTPEIFNKLGSLNQSISAAVQEEKKSWFNLFPSSPSKKTVAANDGKSPGNISLRKRSGSG